MFPETPENNPGILTCWKDIAQYLGKGVRTVQRWERDFGLPIRRPKGFDHKSAVVAYTHDLDVWLQASWSLRKKKRTANGEPNGGLLETREMIETSRALRKTRDNLVHEMSAALTTLRTLIQDCDQLSKRDAFAFIPSVGQNGDLLLRNASETE